MKNLTFNSKIFGRSILFFAILAACNLFAQPQPKRWYFNGEGVNFTASPPTTFQLSGAAAAATASSAANGVYDAAGNMLFYVRDNNVYNSSGAFVEFLEIFSNLNIRMGPNIVIVPVPGSCTKYYIIYLFVVSYDACGLGCLFLKQELRYSVYDLTENNNTGGIIPSQKHVFITELLLDDVGSFAVSKLNSNNERHIYFVGSEAEDLGSVLKCTLDANDIVYDGVIYSTTSADDFSTSQVVISRNQEMLAWASLKKIAGTPVNDVTLIHLDPLTGAINTSLGTNGITFFDLPGSTFQSYTGIEFSPDNTKLLVGALNLGVFWIDLGSSAVSSLIVNGSAALGNSQLGVAYGSGWIYSATSGNNLQAIDVSNQQPFLASGPGSSITFAGPSAVIGNVQTTLNMNISNPPILTLPGLVDGDKANGYDLYTQDVPADIGEEPDIQGGNIMWISDDIWVRNQPDGFITQVHENPVIQTAPNYIYVRVRNLSCFDYVSSPSEMLHLYWAKAATALSWPIYWDGTVAPCATNAPMGGEVPSAQQVPNIPAGGSQIVQFSFNFLDPTLYSACNPEPWHFCLLSRIVSVNDPMTFTETVMTYDNVKNNNNIAWKNITVVERQAEIPHDEECYNSREVGGVIAVGNPFNGNSETYDLEFRTDEDFDGKSLVEQAEIKITLDDYTWQKWAAGGYLQENIEIKRQDCNQVIVTGNPARLKKLTYSPLQRSTINLSFNFLTDKVDEIPEFNYHVIQTRDGDEKIIGGELYKIVKPERDLFSADGGNNKNISSGENTTLSANAICEDAYYNWYDSEGNLIYSGTDLTVSPEITTKYKLEVVATSDGFTSYDEVTVHVKEFEIKSVSPNPATDQLTVEYKIENASSAYLQISQPGGSSNNYILNTSTNSINLDVSSLTPGNYNILLICNGAIQDQKTIVIL